MAPRVFVNTVDNFTSRNISRLIGKTSVGAAASSSDDETPQPSEKYFIVGSVSHPSKSAPLWVDEVIKPKVKEDLETVLLSCDVIIYDITSSADQVDEASWAVSLLNAECASFKTPKTFICVSTCLTWAKTKIESDDPDAALPEEDYRRRKPHPNYKAHINTEKLVIKMGKGTENLLLTYVVAAGALYGAEESAFHALFKMAWQQDPAELPLYGNGANFVPTIHIDDLSNILVNVIESKPENRYLLAVDEAFSTLEEITRAISSALGTGKVRIVPKDDALANKDILELDFYSLTTSIRLQPGTIKEFSNLQWVAQAGFVENIATLVKEFKKTRSLMPLKLCLLGPPASGKTYLAKQLCQFYKIHHINLADVIAERIAELEKSAASLALTPEEGGPEDPSQAEADKEVLDALVPERAENNGKLSEERVISWVQRKINSMPCRNQGYVLDGYPKIEDQAKVIFANPAGENPDEPEAELLPEFVFVLNAPDSLLRERVMNLPEAEVEGTHNTEEGFTRRLAEYKARNSEETTVANFFDALEIHPTFIDMNAEGKQLMSELKKIIGAPRNYGPTDEEKAIIAAKIAAEENERKAREMKEELERQKAKAKADAERKADWAQKLAEVKRQEQEALEAASAPLRNYLMKHLMPTLTQGLVEVCKAKPDDPVDFLAEYLFKLNPQID